jgi:hypothetical protein
MMGIADNASVLMSHTMFATGSPGMDSKGEFAFRQGCRIFFIQCNSPVIWVVGASFCGLGDWQKLNCNFCFFGIVFFL